MVEVRRPNPVNLGLLGFVWVVGGPDTAPDLGKRALDGGTSRAHETERATEATVAVLSPPLLGCRIGKPRWRGQARSPAGGPKALVRAAERLDGDMRQPRLASQEGSRFTWSAGLSGCSDSSEAPTGR